MCRRYEGLGRVCKSINPPSDLNAFIKTLNIPESITVSRHNFNIPQGAKAVPQQQLAQVSTSRYYRKRTGLFKTKMWVWCLHGSSKLA